MGVLRTIGTRPVEGLVERHERLLDIYGDHRRAEDVVAARFTDHG